MGYQVGLFDEPVDEEWICGVCHDVFESPVCTPCGHSFCKPCLQVWLHQNLNTKCPECRRGDLCLEEDEGNNCFQERVLERIIGKAKVTCCGAEGTATISEEEPARSRRRLNNGDAQSVEADDDQGCGWIGTLEEWVHHNKMECPVGIIRCSVEGCSLECKRREMPKHLADDMVSHMELIVNANTKTIEKKFQKKLAEQEKHHKVAMEAQTKMHEAAMVDHYISQFCQQWIRHKPDALYDFRVYRELTDKYATKILVGVPGPSNTCWEGAAVSPLVLSLHEILFAIQQLLAHPNIDSPAQSAALDCLKDSRDRYDGVAKDLADHYSTSGWFWARMSRVLNAFGLDSLSMKLVADSHAQWIFATVDSVAGEPVQQPRPQTPKARQDCVCSCSCCAWASTFWDKKKDMRFLLGV